MLPPRLVGLDCFVVRTLHYYWELRKERMLATRLRWLANKVMPSEVRKKTSNRKQKELQRTCSSECFWFPYLIWSLWQWNHNLLLDQGQNRIISHLRPQQQVGDFNDWRDQIIRWNKLSSTKTCKINKYEKEIHKIFCRMYTTESKYWSLYLKHPVLANNLSRRIIEKYSLWRLSIPKGC